MPGIFSWHPTFAFFRNPYEYGAFHLDLDRFARMIRGQLREGPRELVTHPTVEHLRILSREKYLFPDLESAPVGKDQPWTAKDPMRASLRVYGIGTAEWGISIMWKDVDPFFFRELRRIHLNKKIVKVYQNGWWFDIPLMARYNLPNVNVMDIRDMRRSVSSTSRLNLGYMSTIYDDPDPWKDKEDEDNEKGVYLAEDPQEIKLYNAKDTVRTGRVFHGILQEEEWNTPRTQRLYEVHTELSQIASRMFQTGIQVDDTWRKFMAMCLDQEREEKVAQMNALLVYDGKWKPTPNNMAELIFERYAVQGRKNFGIQDPQDAKQWKDGEISVDKASLIQVMIEPDCPDELKKLIELSWEARRAQTWKTQYLTGKEVMNAIGPDGRLRPGWNSCGTDTMRFSCSDPNVMNVPEILRKMYKASKGHVLVHADKSQFELQVMARRAPDHVLLEALQAGDVYKSDAVDFFPMLNLSIDMDKDQPPMKKPRKASKIIHLGSQYGAGIKTVWAQALQQDRGVSFSLAKDLNEKFKKRYWQTVRYWEQEYRATLERGYSEGAVLFGRRYYPRPPELAKSVNYPIQRTAAEIVNLEMIALDRALRKYVPDAKLIIQLHDAFDVDSPTRKAGQVRRIMQEVMGESQYEINGVMCSFPVDIKEAVYWNEV